MDNEMNQNTNQAANAEAPQGVSSGVNTGANPSVSPSMPSGVIPASQLPFRPSGPDAGAATKSQMKLAIILIICTLAVSAASLVIQIMPRQMAFGDNRPVVQSFQDESTGNAPTAPGSSGQQSTPNQNNGQNQ